jgi:hypothetical protein
MNSILVFDSKVKSEGGNRSGTGGHGADVQRGDNGLERKASISKQWMYPPGRAIGWARRTVALEWVDEMKVPSEAELTRALLIH